MSGATPRTTELWLPVYCDTVTHMKTTIEISDAILEQAKAAAAREGTTLRALVEDGLRQVLKTRRVARTFRLRDASVGGDGLRPEFRDAGWDKIRDALYEGRE
jgi:Arc/MetJ family transcription regulator